MLDRSLGDRLILSRNRSTRQARTLDEVCEVLRVLQAADPPRVDRLLLDNMVLSDSVLIFVWPFAISY